VLWFSPSIELIRDIKSNRSCHKTLVVYWNTEKYVEINVHTDEKLFTRRGILTPARQPLGPFGMIQTFAIPVNSCFNVLPAVISSK